MRLPTVLTFHLGAPVYDWFTHQPVWWGSCEQLARGLPSGGRVLDLGVGPGVSAIVLARVRPDCRIIGLDLASGMLRLARRRVVRAGVHGRVGLLRADAARLPFADGCMDAVVGHSFLYLVPQRAMVLAEALRVLRPGGVAAFMEPNAAPARPMDVLRQSRDPRFLVSVALWRPFSALHGRFSSRSLTQALAAAGFESPTSEPVLGGLGLIGRARKPFEELTR